MAEAVRNSSDLLGALPDQYGVAGALSTLATLFSQDGNYSQALEYLQNQPRCIGNWALSDTVISRLKTLRSSTFVAIPKHAGTSPLRGN